MDLISFVKIITIIWIYGIIGFILVARVTGSNYFVKALLKISTIIVAVYVTLLLLGILTI